MKKNMSFKKLLIFLFVFCCPICMKAAVSFLSLDNLIVQAKEIAYGNDSSLYPVMAISELRDLITLADALHTYPQATQTLINSYKTELTNKIAAVKICKGITMDETYVLQGEYKSDRGFRHPGALHTQADFDRIKAQLAAGNATVTAAYKMLTDNDYAQSTAYIGPVDTIYRGGTGVQNYIRACRASHIAYLNALRWKISGDKSYAQNGIKELNDWAKNCKYVSGDTNLALAAGLSGYAFANAGELLRDFSGWNHADFLKFQEWMRHVWFDSNITFLRSRFGTWQNSANHSGECPGHYWSNWGLCNALSAITIGILCDDPYIYNQGLSFYKYDHVGTFTTTLKNPSYNEGLNEFVGFLVPVPVKDNRGPFGYLSQMQESGRDQGHAQMALGLAVDICQTALNQGDDLYAYLDNRLAAGIEWQMAFNTYDDSLSCASLPWTQYYYRDCRHTYASGAWIQTQPSYASRPTLRAYIERILGYYEGIKGVSMRFTEKAKQILGVEPGGGGSTSGGYDHLGLTTLTCHRDKISSEMAPTDIISYILYDGNKLKQSELGGIKATYDLSTGKALERGSKVTLMPSLADSIVNTGKWKWDTGEVTQNLEITADRSRMYRVTYTNARGIESTATFTIAVVGDSHPTYLTPTITYENNSTIDTTVTILAFSDVNLKAVPYIVWGSRQWNNGQTTDNITVANISSSRDYTMIYTNEGGAQTKEVFHINVIGMKPQIVVNNTVMDTDSIIVQTGQKVVLRPVASDRYRLGQWLWSNGSTADSLIIDKVTKSEVIHLFHTIGNRTDTLCFKLECAIPEYNLADGNYHIIENSTDKYLTAGTLSTPKFTEKTIDGDLSQIWAITRYDSTYQFVSSSTGKILNANARLASISTFDPVKNTYSLFNLDGTMLYAIKGSESGGSEFWAVNQNNIIDPRNADVLSSFPFRFERVLATGIEKQKIEGSSLIPGADGIYDLQGRKISPLSSSDTINLRGIYILRQSGSIQKMIFK